MNIKIKQGVIKPNSKKINEKKKQILEMDNKYDDYYKRISDIKNKFSNLLSNEFSENNNSIEQLK